MSTCSVVNNIRDGLIEAGIIDNHNNIIGNTEDTYKKIDEVNLDIQNKYGSLGKNTRLLDTYTTPGNFANRGKTKMSFNDKVSTHIEGIENKTNTIYKFLQPGVPISSKEVLTAIAKENHPVSELANSLLSVIDKNNVMVIMVPVSEMGDNGYQGVYYEGDNIIKISEGAVDVTAVRTLVHEILHALTAREISQNPDSKAVKDLEKLLEDAKWLSGNKELYGYKNAKEFAVAVLTDPKVLADMRTMPRSGNVNIQGKSIFEQIVNNLLNLLGFKRNNQTLLDQAILTVDSIINDNSVVERINFENQQVQEYWDSISDKYKSMETDLSEFNQEDNTKWVQGTLDFDNEQPLNSPYSVNDDTDIFEIPQSLGDWVKSRMAVLNNLKKLHNRYYKMDRKNPNLSKINRAIEQIESQIEEVKDKDPVTIRDSVKLEFENLKVLLDLAKNNPVDAMSIMENNDINKRIQDLRFYFLKRDANDRPYNSNLVSASFYDDFREFFGSVRPEEMKDIEDTIESLTRTYADIKSTIIQSGFLNNTYVKQHIQTKKLSQDNIEEVLQKIEAGEFEVSTLASKFLGLGSGGGILGQLLYLKKEEAAAKENAYVGNELSKMMPIWEKIKNLKDSNGEYVINKLFQKDRFGVVIKNRLISKFSDSFSSLTKQIYAERNNFQTTKNSRDYAIWQKMEKDAYDRIDIRKFPAVYKAYSNDKRFAKFFQGITEEQANEYDKMLLENLGPIQYQIEVEKSLEMLDDYIHGIKTGDLTPRQEEIRNPFAYLDNFYSDNYDKINNKTGQFSEPTYTRFVPKFGNPDYYNKDFKEVEDNQDLTDFYISAYKLSTEYNNPTFQSEGVNVGMLELQTFEDMLDRGAYEDLNFFGRVSANIKALARQRKQKYADSALANIDDRLSTPGHDRQRLVVGYSGEVRNRLATIKETLKNLSPEQLIQRAKDLGINTNIEPKDLYRLTKKDKVKNRLYYDLVESIARAKLNQTTSSNIMESIYQSSYMAADVRARRSVTSTLEMFKDIANVASISKGANREDVKNTNIYNMLNMWGQSNVYGEKFAGDMKNMGNDIDTKIAKYKLGNWRIKSGGDKIAEKEIRDIIDKSDFANETFEFEYGGNKYNVVNGKFYKNKTIKHNKATNTTTIEGDINIKEFKEAYLKSKLDNNIGTPVTVGSLLLGYMDNVRAIQLGFSPRAGVKNRLAGMSQTMTAAASGRFDFDINDYHTARRFLRGVNTRMYASKLGWDINRNNPKYQQVQMLEQLISNLQLEQNRADELAMEAKFNSGDTSSMADSLSNFMMDFAMNNPEKHNQLEIAVAIMMNTEIEDKHGNKHKFFNPQTMSFTMYKPGTLELKDEFDTPMNKDLWEKFQSHKDSEGNLHSNSIAMTTKIRATIEKTQGNYNSNDIVMVQNSVGGKLMTMYTRYLFENTNLQWGTQFVDLRTGDLHIKGRKVAMFEHTPTALAYLTSNFTLPILSASITLAALNPVVIGTLGIAGAIGIGFLVKQKTFNLQSAKYAKEWAMAKDFLLETLLRIGKTPLNTFSYGSLNSSKIDKGISNLQNKTYDGMLTEKDRKLISECAQELATKFMLYSTYTLLGLLAKFMYTALLGDDDEEEGYVERKIKDLVNIENVINSLLNDRNQVMGDINRYISPGQLYSDATAFALFRTLARDSKTVFNTLNGKYSGNEDQMIYDWSKIAAIPGINIIPNNAKKAIYGLYNEDVGIFSDTRVYEGRDQLDKWVGKNTKKGEDFYKAEAKDKRKALREDVLDYYEDLVSEEMPDLSRAGRKEEVKKRTDEFMKQVRKDKDQTNQELVESDVFQYAEEELKRMKGLK